LSQPSGPNCHQPSTDPSFFDLERLALLTLPKAVAHVSVTTMKKLLWYLGFLATLVVIVSPARGADARPNIVVVVVDDLRWDELSCTGHPVVLTPHIDRVANEGVRFRNAFATTPLCSPSRASLLTGQYAHRHGIIDNTNRSELSHRLMTFPRLLHDGGYETAFIGKWHMGNDDSARPGFDHWISLPGQGTSQNPELNMNGKRERRQGYTTDVLNEFATTFVRRQHDKPFLLYVAHKALHPETIQFDDGRLSDPNAAKFIPAPRHATLYASSPVSKRLNATDTLDGKPALQRKIDKQPSLGPKTGTPDETIRERWRMLAAVDEGVGELLHALAEANTLDDTVFIFTSDHGYWYGEHGLSVERRLAYEEGIRIPLFIRYPRRIKAGRLVDETVLTLDLAPTVAALGAIESAPKFDGRTLVPLFGEQEKHPDDWRRSFMIEYFSDVVFPRTADMGYQAIRTERFKYIHYTQLNDMDELYDLQQDPYEMSNIIHAPANQTILNSLKNELDQLAKP
jgi:N-acetylglucosamine-6-sulfatase